MPFLDKESAPILEKVFSIGEKNALLNFEIIIFRGKYPYPEIPLCYVLKNRG